MRFLSTSRVTILLVYVDAIILIGDDVEEMERLMKGLASEFEIKDLGLLKYFLGMEVTRSKKGIVVSKKKYIIDLLKETSKNGCKPSETPIDANWKLGDSEKKVPVDIKS